MYPRKKFLEGLGLDQIKTYEIFYPKRLYHVPQKRYVKTLCKRYIKESIMYFAQKTSRKKKYSFEG